MPSPSKDDHRTQGSRDLHPQPITIIRLYEPDAQVCIELLLSLLGRRAKLGVEHEGIVRGSGGQPPEATS